MYQNVLHMGYYIANERACKNLHATITDMSFNL